MAAPTSVGWARGRARPTLGDDESFPPALRSRGGRRTPGAAVAPRLARRLGDLRHRDRRRRRGAGKQHPARIARDTPRRRRDPRRGSHPRPLVASALIVLLGFALLPAEHAVHPQGDSLSSSSDLFFGVLFAAVVVAWGMFRRSRRQTKREQLGRAQAEEQLRAEQIRHAERERIAREMHDVLAHRISLLSLHAGALEFRPDAPPEEIARAVAVIRASAHQALEDLRSVIGTLRDGADGEKPPPPQPTLAALPVLLDESRAAGMQLYADVHVADLAAVPDGIGRHALRIVQEALTNARKHAPSAEVDLRLEGAPGQWLTIEVRNPTPVGAAGASEIPGSGTGLVGLAERAALTGGRLDHGFDRRGDFYLRAWLPWP